MTDFNRTNWAKKEFSSDYVEKADIYIVERRRMFAVVVSLYSHLVQGKTRAPRVLDLGCGDGVLSHELLKQDPGITATLADGSEDMLSKAGRRLTGFANVSLIRASFQELIAGEVSIGGGFDFVCSSMAIHHLAKEEKRSLFVYVHDILAPGGFFANIDVVLAPTDPLDDWYMKLWEDWMNEKRALLGRRDENSTDIIKRYKSLDENKPDTLDTQLDALKETGFGSVDCFFKYGIFTVFGGMK